MKKKLESELISIAHNILKLKGKEDIDALLAATQKVYEKLTVLKFVEEHFGGVKPTIGKSEVVNKFEEMAGNVMTDHKEVPETNPNEEDLVAPLMETIKGMLVEMPSDKKEETFEDLLAGFATEPMFVKKFEEMAGNVMTDNKEVPETNPNEDDIVSPLMETIKGMLVEMPNDKKQETLEDILSGFATEPMFVKKDEEVTPPTPEVTPEVEKEPASPVAETPEPVKEETPVAETPTPPVQEEVKENVYTEPIFEPVAPEKPATPEPPKEPKQLSLNDRLYKAGIQIGLNDRIGFVKHLFAGSDEDYNRVISQLNTATSFEEAQRFIEQMVKPDYNNWEGKEDYEVRLYTILEKKFN